LPAAPLIIEIVAIPVVILPSTVVCHFVSPRW
jgi:hypothetical protein